MAAAVAAIRREWQNLPPVGAEALFWILFGGIGPVGLAYHWWEIGVKRGHVPLISTLAYFIPIRFNPAHRPPLQGGDGRRTSLRGCFDRGGRLAGGTNAGVNRITGGKYLVIVGTLH